MAYAADGGVLDGADHDASPELTLRADGTPDAQRDGFGAAAREDDLVGLRADRPRDRDPSVVEQPAGPASGTVDRQRISERVERGNEGIARGRQQRGRGRPVEVDVRGHGRSPSTPTGRVVSAASPSNGPGRDRGPV